MKKHLSLLMLVCVLCSAAAHAARPTAILGPGMGGANFRVPYHETVDRVLSRDTTYILTGWYFIDSTYSITIPAGTLIRGDSASGGTIIIKRGAKIWAQGTRECPIVFTDNKPAGTRVPGDWGGVILAGSSVTNRPTTMSAEGGFGTIPNTTVQYGGSDPDDNSGILSYVRIEFAGIAFSQDNEVNGLSLYGIGRGTTLDHIQVSFANDDDIEMFGGTVDVRYYIGWRMIDDDIDTDVGYSGRIQFAYEKRDPNIFDASAPGQSHGFESDGEPPVATPAIFPDFPHTSARVSNVTIVGPEADTNAVINAHWSAVAILRRADKFSIYNSILMGYPEGLDIRDTATQRYCLQDSLQIHNVCLQAKRKVVITDASPSTPLLAFNVNDWFDGVGGFPATGNLGGDSARQPSAIGLPAAAFNLDRTNNAVPLPGSEAATAPAAFDGWLAGDAFFDTTAKYRGAFDPNLPRDQQWDWGWSEYEPENYDPEASLSHVAYNFNDSWNMISLPMKLVDNANVTALFPTATSSAFSYQGSYIAAPSLTHGPGYWLKFSGSQSSDVIGCSAISDTFNLSAKWNMIGSVTRPVKVSTISSNPPAIVVSNYFGYNGSYQIADTIKPGQAYWVKTDSAGQLYVNGFSNTSAPKAIVIANPANIMNKLVITDKLGHSQQLYFGEDKERKISPDRYELPPLPPDGGFDARFSSGRMLEITSGQNTDLSITVHGGTYPLTVSLTEKQSGQKVQLVEMLNGNAVKTHALSGSSSIVLSNGNFDRLVLKTEAGSLMPTSFVLHQNYPNPFNPTTRFDIEVPQESRVEVSVYDVLGQKVATLLNGMTAAGYHTLEWNAVNTNGNAVPSGIYLVRMNSEKFTAVQKIMLMK